MNSIKSQLESAKLTPIDLVWFERISHRKFAPTPPCVLRRLAKRAGFKSTVEFLAAEHKMQMEHKLHSKAER